MISPDDLIPPDSELGQQLAQWSEDTDTRTWNIANITNDLIEELEGGIATRQDVYRAVATRCKGKKPNTIRRWAEVAADYSPKLQKKYAQLLSFDHFKTSRRLFSEGYSPTIEYALDWCVSGNDMKLSAGRFHTVGEMLNHFLPQEEFGNELQRYWKKTKDKLYDLILLHDHDIERHKMQELWDKLDDQVANLTLDKALDIG